MVSARPGLPPAPPLCNSYGCLGSEDVLRGRRAFGTGRKTVSGVLTPAAHDVQDTAIHGLKHRKSATASVASVLGDAPDTLPRYAPRRCPSGSIRGVWKPLPGRADWSCRLPTLPLDYRQGVL